MLWRVRTTLADRPGTLAALTERCGREGVNILELQIFPDADVVTDELVLRVPDGWGLPDVAALVEDSGGRQVSIAPCTAHALSDTPTRYVRAAARLVDQPEALQAVLEELLDASDRREGLAALQDRLDVGAGTARAVVSRTVPFTQTERARANALADLAGQVEQAGQAEPAADLSEAAWGGSGGPAAASADARAVSSAPVVRIGQAGDAAAVSRMHARCSPEVLLRRYHVPMPRLTWRTARRLVCPPGGGSLVAVTGGEVVGMAVVAPLGERVMEVGLLVEDRWQHRGVGSTLLYQAARLAVRRGAADLLCVMRADNRSLLPTVQRSGLTCRLRANADVVDVRIPLQDVPPPDIAAVQPAVQPSVQRVAAVVRPDPVGPAPA